MAKTSLHIHATVARLPGVSYRLSCIDSESGVTLCNQFPIRRPDTWLSFDSLWAIICLLAILWNKDSISSPSQDIGLLSVLGSRPWPFRVTWRHWSRDHLIPR